MNEVDRAFDEVEDPNRDDSPFAVPAVEGIPYERDSEEDLAIKRVIEESERAREHAAEPD